MDWGTRIVILFKYALFAAAFGSFPVGIAAAVADYNNVSIDNWPWPWPFVIGIALGFVGMWFFLRYQIAESDARLRDPDYQALLRRAGYKES